jgi:hypothetical protein
METSSGNLIALVCHREYDMPYSTSMSMIRNLRTNTINLLERNSDIYWPNAIRIQNKYDIMTIKKIGIIFTSTSTNPTDVKKSYPLVVPFNLIKKISVIEVDKQYTTIYIPISLFFKQYMKCKLQMIPLLTLNKYTTSINITSDIDMYYDIIGKYTYLETTPRRDLAQKSQACVNNIFHTIIVSPISSQDNLQTLTMPVYGVMSGLFIETDQLPTYLELIFNTHTYWKYDEYMVKHLSQKICSSDYSKYKKYLDSFVKTTNLDVYTIEEITQFVPMSRKCLYWIPIEYQKKWDDVEFGSTLDLSRSDRSQLKINSSFNGTIHLMLHHLMCIVNGNISFTLYQNILL